MPVEQDQTLQGRTTRLHPPAITDKLLLDSDDAEYICCTLEFDNELDHLSHMISHIAENIILLQRVQCDYCNYSFNNYNGLKRHLRKHLGFICYYCQQHIPKWQQLVQHVMYEHNYKIKHGNKSNSNKQHNKFNRRATEYYTKNKKRFKRKFQNDVAKGKQNIKTQQGNYTDYGSTIKTEPYVKSEQIFCANDKSEPIFNSSTIKTEPTIIKIEPIDY